jgi:hypothetical protein
MSGDRLATLILYLIIISSHKSINARISRSMTQISSRIRVQILVHRFQNQAPKSYAKV